MHKIAKCPVTMITTSSFVVALRKWKAQIQWRYKITQNKMYTPNVLCIILCCAIMFLWILQSIGRIYKSYIFVNYCMYSNVCTLHLKNKCSVFVSLNGTLNWWNCWCERDLVNKIDQWSTESINAEEGAFLLLLFCMYNICSVSTFEVQHRIERTIAWNCSCCHIVLVLNSIANNK